MQKVAGFCCRVCRNKRSTKKLFVLMNTCWVQLETLDLSSNRLTGSLPEAWGNLTNVSPDSLMLLHLVTTQYLISRSIESLDTKPLSGLVAEHADNRRSHVTRSLLAFCFAVILHLNCAEQALLCLSRHMYRLAVAEQ